jgi:hypothetical protein
VVTGQLFDRPLRHVPLRWLLQTALAVVRQLSPALKENLLSSSSSRRPPPDDDHDNNDDHKTYFLSPLLATAQVVHATRGPRSSAPSLLSAALVEDCTCFSQTAGDGGMRAEGFLPMVGERELPAIPTASERRKKFFADPNHLKQFYFEPGVVYTFEFYQHMLDLPLYKLDVGGITQFDLTRVLDGQPLRTLAMILNSNSSSANNSAKDVQMLWNVELWHERLVRQEGGGGGGGGLESRQKND